MAIQGERRTRKAPPPPLTPEQQQMVLSNRALVFLVLRQIWAQVRASGWRVSRDDLVSAGDLALGLAVLGYRPEAGKFSGYATTVIYHKMRLEIDRARVIPVPRVTLRAARGKGQPIRERTRRAVARAESVCYLGAKIPEIVEDEDDEDNPLSHLGDVASALARLSAEDREMLADRYGLGGRAAQTCTVLALRHRLTLAGMCYRIRRAESRLREIMEDL